MARHKTSASVWRRVDGRRKRPCHLRWQRPAAALWGGGLLPNVERNSQGIKESTLCSTRETRKGKVTVFWIIQRSRQINNSTWLWSVNFWMGWGFWERKVQHFVKEPVILPRPLAWPEVSPPCHDGPLARVTEPGQLEHWVSTQIRQCVLLTRTVLSRPGRLRVSVLCSLEGSVHPQTAAS